jgi:hypothetical protein
MRWVFVLLPVVMTGDAGRDARVHTSSGLC